MRQRPSRSQGTVIAWTVRLAGEEKVLQLLARVFHGPDPMISIDGDEYHLQAEGFLSLTRPEEVMHAGNTILKRMCGIINLYGNYIGEEVWAENAVWLDDKGQTGGIAASLRIQVTAVNPDALLHLNQQVGSQPTATRLLAMASEDEALGGMLEVASWHSLSWADIYVLLELLCDQCGGLEGLSKLGGVSKNKLTQLKRTANDHRHAKKIAGFRPVAQDEAAILICRLSCLWLDARLS